MIQTYAETPVRGEISLIPAFKRGMRSTGLRDVVRV